MPYLVKDFDYHLPPELIAQEPAKPRDHSRLLLLNQRTGALEHKHFYDLLDYLFPGDLLVLNNTKVFPARLIGWKAETKGKVEIFLHHQISGANWECLIGGRVRPKLVIAFVRGLRATILKDNQDGTWQVKFNLRGAKFWKVINQIGLVPLPPYIKRDKKRAADRSRYQTVYADAHQAGSVAAPTAGLHFTKSLLKKIRSKGVKIAYVTLHVGLGTFAPVKVEKISDHKMHSEWVQVSAVTLRAISDTKKFGGRIVAVGTTSCRTLESLSRVARTNRRGSRQLFKKQSFWTDIFIYPGYKFKTVDALITNFHLPKSTLLMLVSTFSGKSKTERAYRTAVRQKYRFFSYGDAMFIY